MSFDINQFCKDLGEVNSAYHKLVTHIYYLFEYEVGDNSKAYRYLKNLIDECFSFLGKYDKVLDKKPTYFNHLPKRKVKELIGDVKKIGQAAQTIKQSLNTYNRIELAFPANNIDQVIEQVKVVRDEKFIAEQEEEVIDLMCDNFEGGKGEEDYQEVDIPELPEDDEEFLENFKTLEEG